MSEVYIDAKLINYPWHLSNVRSSGPNRLKFYTDIEYSTTSPNMHLSNVY